MLYSVTGAPDERVRWCGPSAISIMTGVAYPQALELLRGIKARRRPHLERVVVKGTPNGDMKIALDRLGYDFIPVPNSGGMTFAKWLRERTPEVHSEVVLVSAGGHYMVAHGRKACDNHVMTPVFISKMPGRRKRMKAAWIVRKRDPQARTTALREVATMVERVAARRSTAVAQYGQLYREAQALAKKLGLTIETSRADGGRLDVYPPDGFLLEDLSGYGFSGSNRWEEALSYLRRWDEIGITECLTRDPDCEAA